MSEMIRSEQDWLNNKVEYLKNLKSRNSQQDMMINLAQKKDISAGEKKVLSALIKAEKANERAIKASLNAEKFIRTEKEAERKARTKKLIDASGLLILTGLIDSKTGNLVIGKEEFIGLMSQIAKHINSAKYNHEEKNIMINSGNKILERSLEAKKTKTVNEREKEEYSDF